MAAMVAITTTAVALVVLQTAVLARMLPAMGVMPNLLLVLVVVLGVQQQGVRGALAAFGLGYLLDTFVGTMLGLHALAFTVVFAAVVFAAQTVRADRGLSLVLLVLGAGCLHALVTVAVLRLTVGAPTVLESLRHGAVEAALTALVSPAVVGVVRWQTQVLEAA